MIRINLSIDEETLKRIDKAAAYLGETRSEFIRKAAAQRIEPQCARCKTIDRLWDVIQRRQEAR